MRNSEFDFMQETRHFILFYYWHLFFYSGVESFPSTPKSLIHVSTIPLDLASLTASSMNLERI